jgi:leucyl/phenylalanyl-tRNA--protein transferase
MERIPPHILLGAYTEGVFPMADDGEIHWFSPVMRGVIPLDDRFHIPHGLKKTLKNNPYQSRMNCAFREVMTGCSQRDETWINEVILESYYHLYELGYGYSFESWDDDGLQGGLYGVAIGKAFFGESMFSRKPDASKVALVHLIEWLRENDFVLLDTQWMTDHLRQFGGMEVPREEYLNLLAEALAESEDSD